jgi:hypothetical protein
LNATPLTVDWFFTVDHDPRELCYYAEGEDGSTLVAGTGEHECVFVGDTPELLLEQVEKVRGFVGEGIIARQVTWASLGMCFRMIIYRNKMRLLMGGKGWNATALTYTPSRAAKLICDPQTTVVVAEYKGEMITINDGIIVGSSLEDLFNNLSLAEVDVQKFQSMDDLKFCVYPLLKFASGETLYYHGNTHNVQEALMTNYNFVSEVLGGDEEDQLIAKLEEDTNEN